MRERGGGGGGSVSLHKDKDLSTSRLLKRDELIDGSSMELMHL